MKSKADQKNSHVLYLLSKAERLAEKGEDCLIPKPPDCCPCKHQGSDFITIDGKPAACGCGQCKRYRCLACTHPGNTTAFCTVQKQLEMADL